MDEIRLQLVDPTSEEAGVLLAALDAYQVELYPAVSLHLMPAATLKSTGAVFLGAYLGEQLIGCGAYVNHDGQYGELKRMYVHKDARGQGIGYRLLNALEAHAREVGLTVLRLETGIYQPEALKLYERAGYSRCGPFGTYPDDPLSVYLEKHLDR